jgi:hypothetical protein
VPLPLVERGIIASAGYRRSERPEAHGRPLTVWQLADRAAALAWLAAQPDCTDPEPAAPIQRGLWDDL